MKTLEPFKIGNLEVKNRVAFAPMGYSLDRYGPLSRAYFEARCKGGAGMIFTHFLCPPLCEGGRLAPEALEDIKKMSAMAHSYGAKACLQIFLGLGRVKRFLAKRVIGNSPVPTYCASAVPEFMFEDRICEEVPLEDIKEQIEFVCKSAKWIAEESGYDAIELHSYGGYLCDSFLTAKWNKRTDEYGGTDIWSRSKYLRDMIAAVREGAGPDFPLIVKFTPCHYIEEEGYRTIEEGIELAKIIEAAGADMLHVDAGCYENWHLCMPPTYQQEETYAVRAAEIIRKAVNIPVAAAGKLGYPERGESALVDGKVDYLVVGRPMLADPEYVNKLEKGCLDDIRPCIGCNEGCNARVNGRSDSISCAVNPDTGFEMFHKVPQVKESKKMLVIGGGIGGMSFAYDARKAGHDVEIWEARSVLGGLLTAAGRPHFKREISDLVQYFRLQLAKMGVRVRYNMTPTAEDILAYKADHVILATGLEVTCPKSIPGLDGANVIPATDALNNIGSMGKRLVIVGSGLVGCEAALYLVGFGKEIDIIEMQDDIMPVDVWIQSKLMVKEMLDREDAIHIHTSTKLLRVEEDGVVVLQNGEEKKILCDTVVNAMGITPVKNGLKEQLEGKVDVRDLGANRLVLHATTAARETLLDICGVPKEEYTRTIFNSYDRYKKQAEA